MAPEIPGISFAEGQSRGAGIPAPRFSPSRRRAFTLMEMLIAFGLTSLFLIALIVRTGLMSRERARRAICTNNLRQIGNGLGILALDAAYTAQNGPSTPRIFTKDSTEYPLGLGLTDPAASEGAVYQGITIRVTGTKFHSFTFTIYEDGTQIAQATITRQPGNPDLQSWSNDSVSFRPGAHTYTLAVALDCGGQSGSNPVFVQVADLDRSNIGPYQCGGAGAGDSTVSLNALMGVYPDSTHQGLGTLYIRQIVGNVKVFYCPGQTVLTWDRQKTADPVQCGYAYRGRVGWTEAPKAIVSDNVIDIPQYGRNHSIFYNILSTDGRSQVYEDYSGRVPAFGYDATGDLSAPEGGWWALADSVR